MASWNVSPRTGNCDTSDKLACARHSVRQGGLDDRSPPTRWRHVDVNRRRLQLCIVLNRFSVRFCFVLLFCLLLRAYYIMIHVSPSTVCWSHNSMPNSIVFFYPDSNYLLVLASDQQIHTPLAVPQFAFSLGPQFAASSIAPARGHNVIAQLHFDVSPIDHNQSLAIRAGCGACG